MKKLCLLIYSILTIHSSFGQNPQHEISLDKNEMILETVFLGEKGFILKTGNPTFAGKRTNRLLYFTDKGKLVWEKKIENEYQAIKSENLTVSSPDASFIYHIEVKRGDFAGEKQYLTQITEKGELKKTPLAIGNDYGKSLLSVFCDEQYLYFLTSQNGDEFNEKKKVTEKVILNRFAHNGLSYKKFVLDLPALSDAAISSFWSFAGQNKQGKYLVSKRFQPESSQQTVDLVSFNLEGEVTGKITISYDSFDKFTRPSSSISHSEGKESHLGSRNLVNINFEPTSSVPLAMTSPGTAAGPSMINQFHGSSEKYTNAAFGYLYIDATDAVYIYGLTGPKAFKRVGSSYEGFYVYKYDSNGKEIWKLRNEGSKELLETKFYTTHGRPQDRYIGLVLHPDQKLTFSIAVTANLSAKPDMFLFDISQQGQVSGTYSTKDAAGESALVASLTPKAKEYVKKQPLGKSSAVFAGSFPTPSGEVLLMGSKEGKLNILFFEK